jgi:translation elongation factor EF-4
MSDYIGDMMELCTSRRATNVQHQYIELAGSNGVDSGRRVLLTATVPLAEVVTNFFDTLKHRSSGYASFELSLPTLNQH